MDSGWTDIAIALFPWIGGGAAVVLLILLFGTRVLQSEPGDRDGMTAFGCPG